jgi:hypothetical protein
MAFPESSASFIPYKKSLRIRSTQNFGLWIDPESLPGPRVIADKDQNSFKTCYLFSHADIVDGLGNFPEISLLNADGYLVIASSGKVIVSPIYAFVGSEESLAIRDAAADLQNCISRFRSEHLIPGPLRIAAPVLLWADFMDSRGLEQSGIDEVIHAGIPVFLDKWHAPSNSFVRQIQTLFFQ